MDSDSTSARREWEPTSRVPVPRLSEAALTPGQRWIYSAGFNVRPDLAETERVDAECRDLDRLAKHGCRTALLSHQGDHADGSARHLNHIADYLSRRLGRTVGYFPEAESPAAVHRAQAMSNGEIVLFGNTRLHPGEQANDRDFARNLAEFGDAVVVGGFSKAHRAHASNVGVLEFLPGYVADGFASELARLAPWAGADTERFSVAAVGGLKPEKTEIGLSEFTRTYDLVLPGGAVLNALLACLGYEIGESALGGDAHGSVDAASEVVRRCDPGRLHIPEEVVVVPTRDFEWPPRIVRVRDGVPAGHVIVDFVWRPWTLAALRRLASEGGRAVLAGPLSYYRKGFTRSTDQVLDSFAAPHVDALLLGGDTTAELPWSGAISTGGGSALQYLAQGTCTVLDALRTARTGPLERT